MILSSARPDIFLLMKVLSNSPKRNISPFFVQTGRYFPGELNETFPWNSLTLRPRNWATACFGITLAGLPGDGRTNVSSVES